MVKITQLDILIFDSLNKVDQDYYSTVFDNIDAFRGVLAHRAGQFSEIDFLRYGERVFCYELYHQLRLCIGEARKQDANFLKGAILQGEVNKMMLDFLLNRFGLQALTKDFVPDFLIHSPNNSSQHPCVIEVKSINNLSEDALFSDLQKLDEFVNSFHYEQGYCITVNTSSNHINNLLNSLSSKIMELLGHDRIKVICKENQKVEPKIWQL